MSTPIKGPGQGQAPNKSAQENSAKGAAEAAFVRLTKKKRKGGGDPAAAVANALDEIIAEVETEAEEAEAELIADEMTDNLPEGAGMGQAEAIAERLKKKLESTRDRRGPLAQKVRKAFDDL